MRSAIPFILLVGCAMPLAYGQNRETRNLIAHAKRADVSKLDRSLPGQRFADWFVQTVGPDASIVWEANDCGEQTGSAADRQRDLPICAEAKAGLPDGRKVMVRFIVGTQKKGLIKLGGINFCAIEKDGQIYGLDKLSELPRMLKNRAK